jgi:hypothetical protein
MIFVGDDWAEDHHDVHVMDEAGLRLSSRRLPEGLTGIGQLHALIASHAEEPDHVVIGIETDRGLWVEALVAAGYQVFAINPLAVARYRERHHVSGAKSDVGDAKTGRSARFNPGSSAGRLPATADSDSYGSGQHGWLTEYKVVSQESVVPVPPALPDRLRRSALPTTSRSTRGFGGSPSIPRRPRRPPV